jgi:hypothetical protein
MESASRVMTRKALNILKSIAMGEYKPVEEKAEEAVAEKVEEAKEESAPQETGAEEKSE